MYDIRCSVTNIVSVVTAWWLHPASGDHQLFIVLFSDCCPVNSCVLLLLWSSQDLRSCPSSCLDSVNSLLSWEGKHSLQWRPQSLFSSPILCPLSESAPPFSALTSFHLSPLCPLPHLILDRSNCQSGVEDFKQGLKSSHTNTHAHTHIHISRCVDIEHIPLSESSPNLQSHWLFLSPSRIVRQINGRKKDC